MARVLRYGHQNRRIQGARCSHQAAPAEVDLDRMEEPKDEKDRPNQARSRPRKSVEILSQRARGMVERGSAPHAPGTQ